MQTEQRQPVPDFAHVIGECHLVPLPHESAWLAVIRCYRRKAPCEVLEEIEVAVGTWRVGMNRKETIASKREAAWLQVPHQIPLLEKWNDELGGGLYVATPDPDAPRITGTLNIREPRSRL